VFERLANTSTALPGPDAISEAHCARRTEVDDLLIPGKSGGNDEPSAFIAAALL
jgi:hypothetical protein